MQVNRDGVKIYYEVHGEGSKTVLLTHGYSATSAMWTPQIDALKGICKLVIWDMRGHGASDSPTEPERYSADATVADMAAILDAVDARVAVIGGLSLGGYMSLAFHRAHPDRCRALVLCDTGPGYRNSQAREGWNEMARARAAALEQKGLAALGAGAEVALSRHRSAQGLALAARGMLTQQGPEVIESLPGIGAPTLIIVGALDTPFLAGTDYMASKIPGAEKVVLEGAGHAANIDQPKAFNDALTRFLGRLT